MYICGGKSKVTLLSDTAPQPWLPAGAYLALWMTALAVAVYTPTHWLLSHWFSPARPDSTN